MHCGWFDWAFTFSEELGLGEGGHVWDCVLTESDAIWLVYCPLQPFYGRIPS